LKNKLGKKRVSERQLALGQMTWKEKKKKMLVRKGAKGRERGNMANARKKRNPYKRSTRRQKKE